MKARFGLFIHWGIYAIPAVGEWVKNALRYDNESYQKYFDEFNPIDFDPKKWAKAAKDAGMKYAVMTAKHHDGFCLFDSRLTDYKATNTPFGRDIIREFLEAFRSEGLRVGLYYSLIDWHHNDYPHYGDPLHPLGADKRYESMSHDFDNYLDYCHGQIRELCTNYGSIDIFWFDFSYGEMRGEKWRATELVNMVRSLQPDAIIDNRLEGSGEEYGSIVTASPSVYAGDFASPEQIIPPEGIVDENGDSVPWEACITMNNHWGYVANDRDYKSPKLIIRKLVECVSKNGNLLLNVGPDARGNFPDKALEILAQIGTWMKKNGASIYEAGRCPLAKPEWGRFTQKGNKIYAHILEGSIGPTGIPGICADKVKKIRLLADGSEIVPIKGWLPGINENRVFINFGPDAPFTYPLPDDIDTVVEIELKD